MAKPTILAVDDDAQVLRALERDFRHKYGSAYRVVRSASAGAARDALRQLKLRNQPVALLLGDQRADVQTKRQAVLVAAQASHPERVVRSVPRVPDMPSAVWINPPHAQDDTSTAGPSSRYGSSQIP